MSKLKAIHLKYKQAIDSGKKSGHSRVIMCHFDLCNKIGGGSPATVQISSGLESTDLSPTPTADAGMTPEGFHDIEGDIDREEEKINLLDTNDAVQRPSNTDNDSSIQRQSMLNQQLATYRHQKLKRKLSLDSQLLECVCED